ncbi:hypothetical protein GCM10010492_54080 [Saccharothrix mutabilis subsp. mutabilis]|uniref:Carrier domain-containing protein n=1 Tax=Saccharothrix mutabilis subsp. mutabilis TaxID=66855 RepID=A0ABN0UE26_9PSEU
MRTVPELFAAVAARMGDAPAVVHSGVATGYARLDADANRLARRLIAAGVGPDRPVAVAVPRSATMVTTLLAVLKAGGAYLPLDHTYPAARLAHMLADARPVLLVRSSAVALPGDVPEVVVDDPDFLAACAGESAADVTDADRISPLRPDHLMYVIYTSGSTGVPKGVAVPHRGVADLVAAQAATIAPRPGDRVLQWASISFDAAFWEWSTALLSGATLVTAPAEDLLPGPPLRDTLKRERVTHAVLPPVALDVTDPTGVLTGGTVMSTGDRCTTALVAKWAPGRRFFNGYGPTETTVGATISGPVDPAGEVDIGRPWRGNGVHVLDERLDPVPDGEVGELYLTGNGLARGYLGRPGLTATRFVADPHGAPGARMYRSGDRGHRAPDGRLHFAGRADDQVKLRGFRVELGEVEAGLITHPAVDLAVAVAHGGLADARIAAYVTALPGRRVVGAEIRDHAAATLPEHMVPATVVVLDALPTTPNGKADRAALRERAERSAARARGAGVREGAPFAEVLCAVVAEVVGVPDVTPDDNFFDLGGHSVLATALAGRLAADFGLDVPMRALFTAPTLGDLAADLEAPNRSASG